MTYRIHPASRRAGFSLIELLVVIAIIAILIGLGAGAYIRSLGTQQERNTRALVVKLETAIGQQWAKAMVDAGKAPIPAAVTTMAGGNPEIARAIWIKMWFKAEFPMTYAEANNPTVGSAYLPAGTVLPVSPYVKALAGRNSATNPATESAACLLLALQRPRGGMKFDVEQALGASAIKDTDGDGVPELVDGWGRPITFIRWGTDYPDLDALARNKRGLLDRDKDDVEHALMNANWNNSANVAVIDDFEKIAHRITDPTTRAPRSYFTIPAIISSGRDGKLGLNPWTMAPIPGDSTADDNIISFKLRQ